ncbi:MAG: hypothetical protein D6712_03480 [Chloroflexi bacterium]|nr:MAG: hypothetical protein D6712_03480 [Chloroflexota bacterium]
MVSSTKKAPHREQLLAMAIEAAKKKQRDGARVIFKQVLHQDPHNIRAMMWLAKLARNDKERRHWLEQVLAIDPDNELARRKLDEMAYEETASTNRTLFVVGVSIVAVLVVVGGILLLVSLNSG